MRIYNTVTHKKETFTPVQHGKVKMYVCGPTVYDQIHIGNARTFFSFDVIRRYLIAQGYEVTFAQNITDVDDKIIAKAQALSCESSEVAQKFSEAFIEQMRRFHILDPDIRPHATKEIGPMIKMISQLIEKGHAYEAEGDVYFSVRSYDEYGHLSGREIDELQVGARVETNDKKRDPLDFALWKRAKEGEPFWGSPWGKGRPGWHSECSAMVHRYLGTPIDIHGGGSDLQFPHHENESAQACACWEHALANYWMHTGMLLVDGEKMSKSLGNFYTLKEVLDEYNPESLRLLMLQTHYRSSLDFSFERLKGAQKGYDRFVSAVHNLRWRAGQVGDIQPKVTEARQVDQADQAEEFQSEEFWSGEFQTGELLVGESQPREPLAGQVPTSFKVASKEQLSAESFKEVIAHTRAVFFQEMDDDFNTAKALGALFTLLAQANSFLEQRSSQETVSQEDSQVMEECAQTITDLFDIFGITLPDTQKTQLPQSLIELAQKLVGAQSESPEEAAEVLLSARAQARKEKNYALADSLRDALHEVGLKIEDTPQGARVVQN